MLCEAARTANAEAAAAIDTAAPAPTLQVLLTVQPRAALRLVCERLAAGDLAGGAAEATVGALLDLAEAAIWSGRVNPAERLLDALGLVLRTAGAEGTDADTRARYHLLRSFAAHERSEMPRVAVELEQARSTLEAAGLTRTERFVEVLVGQAGVWRHLRTGGGLQKSAEALDQATALLQALGLDVGFAMISVLNERTVLANAQQDLPRAVAAARQEVAMYRRLGYGDSSALLDAQASLAGMLDTLGRFAEAQGEYEEGVRLIDLHPDENPAAALGVLSNLAATHSDRGRLAQALAVADRALAYARRIYGDGSVRSVRPLMVRAGALSRQARYAEARQSLEQALRIATDHREDVGVLRRMNLYESLLVTLIALGEAAEARDVVERGLRETDGVADLGYWRGRLLLRGGIIAAREGDWTAVDAATAQGMALIAPVVGERNHYVLGMWSQRCFAQTNGALPGTACAEVAAALPELNRAAPGYRFRALAVLANDDEQHGRRDAALSHHLQALAAAESAGTPDPLWSAYAALAEHLRARGLNTVAILLGKQAVEQIERMRALLGADAQRFERGFLADKLGVYRRLADWLTEDGRIDEALDVLRLLKEEEFLDFVNRDSGLLGRPSAGPAYSDHEGALRRSWQGAAAADMQPPGTSAAASAAPAAPANAAGAAASAAAADPAAAVAALRREAEFVARWRELLGRLAQGAADAASASGRSGAAAPPASQRRLTPPAGELWVWLYPGDRRINLVVDAPGQRTVGMIDATPADVASAVSRLLGAIERREPVQAQLQSLHALIGVPVERAAAAAEGTRRIVLMVDGPLRYLPFAALHDGRGYLGDRYGIEQRVPAPPVAGMASSSSSSLSTPPGPAGGAARSVLAMGVTQPKIVGMAPLADVAGEICGIVAGPVLGLAAGDDGAAAGACGPAGAARGAMRGSGWLNGAFTAERLETAVAGARQRSSEQTSLLHIGTHFVLRPGRMTRSWLLLGDGRQLSLEALGRFDFTGQALVTLSACETGVGGAGEGGSGDEIDGLGGLMLRRGAGAVVASLWRIADASTSVLMRSFYRHLAAGAAPAEALRRAQSDVRSAGGRFAHPFHWAGFYLVTGMH